MDNYYKLDIVYKDGTKQMAMIKQGKKIDKKLIADTLLSGNNVIVFNTDHEDGYVAIKTDEVLSFKFTPHNV